MEEVGSCFVRLDAWLNPCQYMKAIQDEEGQASGSSSEEEEEEEEDEEESEDAEEEDEQVVNSEDPVEERQQDGHSQSETAQEASLPVSEADRDPSENPRSVLLPPHTLVSNPSSLSARAIRTNPFRHSKQRISPGRPPQSRSNSPDSMNEISRRLNRIEVRNTVNDETKKSQMRQKRKYHSKKSTTRAGRPQGSKAKQDVRAKIDGGSGWD